MIAGCSIDTTKVSMRSRVCQKTKNIENLTPILGGHGNSNKKATHKISGLFMKYWLSASHFKYTKEISENTKEKLF